MDSPSKSQTSSSDALSGPGHLDTAVSDRAKFPRPQISAVGENPDSLGELAQAKIRFGMNVAFILLGLIAYRHDPSIGLAWVWATFSVCVLSALSLYVWARMLGHTLRDPRWRVGQRVASIITDNLAVTWLLFFGGQALAGTYGVYMWITIGYGMRFGLSYLYGNLVASVVGYTLVTQLSPFWKANPSLSIGLGIALVVVPVYAAFLIERLRAAVADARLAYAAKSDFVANMSHELRTPLHGIISVVDLMGRTETSIQQKEMIRIISVSSNTLLDLINRILAISKFEDGTFAIQREQMNLHGVINDTLTILWPQARAKGLVLDFFIDSTVEPNVIGSPRQLQEVLINLIGNAVKFTDEGVVRLNVNSRHAAGDRVGVHFEIVDTGPGLAKEHLEKIFNPFYQADDSVTRKHSGTGLGTAIARELVRLMNGRISVESELGIGTTFHIDISFERQSMVPNFAKLYPVDVAILAGRDAIAILEKELSVFGVKSIGIAAECLQKAAPLPSPPCAIMVDLNADLDITAEQVRETLCRNAQKILIPVCAIGQGSARQRAIDLGYNSFLTFTEPSQGIERLLSMATTLRRDYVSPIVVSESDHKIRVLVAEDNLTNQTIARLALSEGGFDCTIVADGEEALHELTEGSYEIALIDMHMPVMDGMEVARLYNFSVTDPAQRIPLIMVTADSRPEAAADAELAGITRFLTKPLKPSAMIKAINNVLKEKGDQVLSPSKFRASDTSIAPSNTETALLDEETVFELLSYMEDEDRRQFFAEFAEDARSYVGSLDHTKSARELDKIRNAMHALCGAARTVGAIKLAAYARRIEFVPSSDIANSHVKMQSELSMLVAESERALRKVAGID